MQTINIGKKYLVPAACAAVAAVLLIAVLNTAAITRQLNAWKLLPQPERLTELYYENHTKLPVKYLPDTPQNFSFTVHNLEYETTIYTYLITQESEDGQQRRQLTDGSFALHHDTFRTTAVTIAPVDLGPRVKIITTITHRSAQNNQEAIHYWVNKEAA